MATITVCGTGTAATTPDEATVGELEVVASVDVELALEQG